MLLCTGEQGRTTRRTDEYEKDVGRETSVCPVYDYPLFVLALFTLSVTYIGVLDIIREEAAPRRQPAPRARQHKRSMKE